MTEQWLREKLAEAVPPPPGNPHRAAESLIRARTAQRTRVTVLAAVAALAVVATGAAVLSLDRSDTTPEPAKLPDRAAYQQLGAWAAGDEVHVGNHTVTVEGVRELQYTSAGVVVTGSDGYVLVTEDGVVEPLQLDVLDTSLALPGVATDPTSANVAYVRVLDGDRGQAVVRDLATGDETTVGRPFRTKRADGVDWISGDLVSFFRRGDGQVFDWRTGTLSRHPQGGWWWGSGVSVDYDQDGTWTLRSFDGDTLLTVSVDPGSSYGALSPNGRYFAVSDTEPGITVYELATGEDVVIEGRPASGYGWSPDGHLVGLPTLSDNKVEVCDPTTGKCTTTGATATGQLTLVTGIPGAPL